MTERQLTHEESDTLSEAWGNPSGLWGWLTIVNHKNVGKRFIVTGLLFFVVGGVMALLIRTQLAVPESTFLDAEFYNQMFTMHGTTMMFLFAVPMLEGLMIYLMPLMIGTRDMPFPRLNAFAYLTYLFGGIFVFSSFIVGEVPREGWFAYVPLASDVFAPHRGMDFWLLGVTMVEISGIVGGLELVVGFFRRRAPGMSLNRAPLFGWASMVTGAMMVAAFPAIVAASSLLELERATGMAFYDPNAGGDPLLWQHLFWFFGHPEVYIMLLPGLGVLSMIVPVFSRRRHAGYGWVVAALVAIGIASFGLWVHHMYTVGLSPVALAFFSAASVLIAVPAGVIVFSYVATLWGGRPEFRTPLLWLVGFFLVFVIGGISGVMVASVPFDLQVHDTFFLVAHFHYVLIGGMVFPVFAALYYWFPKWTGRMYRESVAKTAFWTVFAGVNLAFFPQHFLGFQGMPRRVFTYEVGLGWELGNMLSTIGAFVTAAGVAIAIGGLAVAMRRGVEAGPDPWRANSLEWAVPSPPPLYNFREFPVVESADPLWDEQSPFETDRPEWLAQLATPEEPAREVIDTSTVEGTPLAVARLPGSSPWPFWSTVAIVVALVGVLAGWTWVAVAGALLTVLSFVAWGAADPHLAHHDPDTPRVGREEGPVRGGAGVWGLGVGLVSVTVIAGSLVFGYWLIANKAESWPPAGNTEMGWLVPLLATGLGVAAVAAVWGAERANGSASNTTRLVLVGVAALLSLGFAATALVPLSTIGSIQGSAYGSIVAALIGFVALLGLAMAFMLISVAARVVAGSPVLEDAFQVTRIYGIYVLGVWVVVAAVVLFGQGAVTGVS